MSSESKPGDTAVSVLSPASNNATNANTTENDMSTSNANSLVNLKKSSFAGLLAARNRRNPITSHKKKQRKRKLVRRGTSPSHFLMTDEEETKYGPSYALELPGRDKIDLILRSSLSLFTQQREVHASGGSVWVNTEYDVTEYSTLDALRSPLRAPHPLESWSPKEIALFEACMCEWGKDFLLAAKHIRTKSTAECVEFYYRVWKHSSHYKVWKYYTQGEGADLLEAQEADKIKFWKEQRELLKSKPVGEKNVQVKGGEEIADKTASASGVKLEQASEASVESEPNATSMKAEDDNEPASAVEDTNLSEKPITPRDAWARTAEIVEAESKNMEPSKLRSQEEEELYMQRRLALLPSLLNSPNVPADSPLIAFAKSAGLEAPIQYTGNAGAILLSSSLSQLARTYMTVHRKIAAAQSQSQIRDSSSAGSSSTSMATLTSAAPNASSSPYYASVARMVGRSSDRAAGDEDDSASSTPTPINANLVAAQEGYVYDANLRASVPVSERRGITAPSTVTAAGIAAMDAPAINYDAIVQTHENPYVAFDKIKDESLLSSAPGQRRPRNGEIDDASALDNEDEPSQHNPLPCGVEGCERIFTSHQAHYAHLRSVHFKRVRTDE